MWLEFITKLLCVLENSEEKLEWHWKSDLKLSLTHGRLEKIEDYLLSKQI